MLVFRMANELTFLLIGLQKGRHSSAGIDKGYLHG